jgi:hypothetical protein
MPSWPLVTVGLAAVVLASGCTAPVDEEEPPVTQSSSSAFAPGGAAEETVAVELSRGGQKQDVKARLIDPLD